MADGEARLFGPGAGSSPSFESAFQTPYAKRKRGYWTWTLGAALALGILAAGIGVGVTLGSGGKRRTASSVSSRSVPVRSGSSFATPAASPSTVAPVGTGYLATGPDFVAFVQWMDNDGSLSGSLQETTTIGSPPYLTTTSQTLPLSGVLNGSKLSLSFQGHALTFGTVSGGSFTLNIPQSDGSLAPVDFLSA